MFINFNFRAGASDYKAGESVCDFIANKSKQIFGYPLNKNIIYVRKLNKVTASEIAFKEHKYSKQVFL